MKIQKLVATKPPEPETPSKPDPKINTITQIKEVTEGWES